MKNKPILLTLILTMLFSFVVTSVIWAECTVTIVPPEAIILYGETLTFVATTEGEGCNPPNYTWEVSEGTCTGGNIDPDTGTYTAGAEDNGCVDTIMVTDTANDGIVDTANVAVGTTHPYVNIDGPITLGSPCPASATYTAETYPDSPFIDDTISGTYSWELDGVSAGTGNTGNTFEVDCTEGGIKVLTVTDIANGGIIDSIMIECQCPPPYFIEATFTGCGTPFIPWFGVVQIEGPPLIEFLITNIVRYDLPLVLPLPRLVNRKDNTITQFVILLPSLFFPVWDYPATVRVTVSVDGLSDTIEIPACGQ